MLQFVNKGAKCMCTGCPGAIARLDASDAPKVKMTGEVQANIMDRSLSQPGFGMCVAIPTAPRKCNPVLTMWVNFDPTVLVGGKPALLFPNMIPCAFGPGLVTMIDPA